MESARLFVGLPLPGEHRRELARLLEDIKPLAPGPCSWTRPDNWHLTLKFLGETPAGRIDDVLRALSGVSWEAFPFRPGGGGFFPGPDRPRVAWVGVAEGGAACRDLARKVDHAVSGLGFEPESRPFAPHLTVARVKGPSRGARWAALLAELLKREWPPVVMDRFVLWRSYSGGGGPGNWGPESGERGAEPGGPPGPRYVSLGEFGASGRTAGDGQGGGEPVATGSRPD